MTPPYRVEKRKPSPKRHPRRGRGRPTDWSASWQKRLIVLRLCGLQLNKILQILNILGDGSFMAKERRAQQLLKQLLLDGYHRLCPLDRTAARKRVAFLRALGRYDQERVINKHTSARFSHSRQSSTETVIYRGHDETTNSDQMETTDMGPPPISAAELAWHEGDMHGLGPNHRIPDIDNRTISPDCNRRLRDVFKRTSFSPSFVSDIMSVLRKRFSTSTLETISACSVSTVQIDEQCGTQHYRDQVSKSRKNHMRKIEQANAALFARCCAKDEDCIHRRIHHMMNRPFASYSPAEDWLEERSWYRTMSTDRDGSRTLFFLASVGAPADVILAALQRTSIHTLDDDGQTFLFSLDPQGFHGTACECPLVVMHHSSKFECLIRQLEQQSFNFDQLDHDGRHFLSFLCASPAFDLSWLIPIMERSPIWATRVGTLAQCRDSLGAFLVDFLNIHHPSREVDSWIASVFRPIFKYDVSLYKDTSRALLGEDELGRTAFHRFVDVNELFQRPIPIHLLQHHERAVALNKYDCQGRYPLMAYLDKALHESVAEDTILATIQLLVSLGANVNARSRSSNTLLHSAAKKALPVLLDYLLSVGADIKHRDNEEFSALDHAATTFSKSKRARSPAELTARALKCMTKLLDQGAESTVVAARVTNELKSVLDPTAGTV